MAGVEAALSIPGAAFRFDEKWKTHTMNREVSGGYRHTCIYAGGGRWGGGVGWGWSGWEVEWGEGGAGGVAVCGWRTAQAFMRRLAWGAGGIGDPQAAEEREKGAGR